MIAIPKPVPLPLLVPVATPTPVPAERDYLSFSAIRTYQNCPLRYFFRYIAGLPEKTVSASLIFGSLTDQDQFLIGGTERLWIAKNLVDVDHLRRVFLDLEYWNGHAPGRDHISYSDLSNSEIYAGCRKLEKSVLGATYQPQSPREVKIAKRSGNGTRTLKLRGIFDRVLARRLDELLELKYERMFFPCSFGFRRKIGREDMLLMLISQLKAGQTPWMVNDDIVNAFDHIPIPPVMDIIGQQTTDSLFLRTTEAILRGGRQGVVGIDQGSPVSPQILNILLHHHLDTPLQQSLAAPTRYARYADNLVYMATDEQEATLAATHLATHLRSLGLSLRGYRPSDLRISPATVLGVDISLAGGRFTIKLGADWLQNIRATLSEALEKPDYRSAVAAATTGWLNAYGMCFGSYTGAERSTIISQIANVHRELGMHESPISILPMQYAWEHGNRQWGRRWVQEQPQTPTNTRQTWTQFIRSGSGTDTCPF